MALCILTADKVLSDFLLAECEGDVRAVSDRRNVRRGEMCIVDAETVKPPYPENTLLVIARKELAVPPSARLLLRPLRVGCVREALTRERPILERGARTVTARGVTVTLSLPEWQIFEALYGACGMPVSRVRLLSLLNSSAEKADGLLTVYVYRLRRLLAPLGFSLRTLRGEGYLLSQANGGDAVC